MNLKLVKASKEYESLIVDMLKEWEAYNNAHPEANGSPKAIFRNYQDFDKYVEQFKQEEIKTSRPDLVEASVFFALDIDRNIIVGACQVRHYLNEALKQGGGHIGDGVRPSERGKGYGKEIIRLALKEAKKLGINDVLISCHSSNPASRKTILANGGVYEKTVDDDGEDLELYWIIQ